MSVNLTDPIFNNEDAARKYFEDVRWPNGPVCPHCGVVNEATELKGKATRPGVYKCRPCAKQFTATVGTVYERSHIPLHKWLLATRLLCASKKGMSAHQLWRMLGFGSYKTAWFMAHRIREGMTDASHKDTGALGGAHTVGEVDESYIGGKAKNRAYKAPAKKAVLSVIERDGRAKSFHVANVTAESVRPIIVTNVNPASTLMTDEGTVYPKLGKEFALHMMVTTSGYGKAAFEFAKGKPLELLDGPNLLHLLQEHAGIEAKIVMPEGWKDLSVHGDGGGGADIPAEYVEDPMPRLANECPLPGNQPMSAGGAVQKRSGRLG